MPERPLPRDIVLLVDDSPDALGFLTEALEASGFSVLIATSGKAALSIVERITPDIILLDAVMPGMDGFATCRKLKSNTTVPQVPVIFMTGLTDTEHVVHALDSGGVDYLTKPINIDELRARIRVHLSNARSTQSARVALDAAGRHLLAVRGDGTIRWSTPQATRLIETNDLDHLSRQISAWLKSFDRSGSGSDVPLSYRLSDANVLRFSFVGSIGADEILLRVTGSSERSAAEILRQHFALTLRESEVLEWIAKGKSNRDIGDILGLSARTVNKHLEQIYVKLGVENRASAAVRAMHVVHAI
ncbi:DNA-binding response regulator (plasmid) [Neorhizobium sp. SOG26]|uniref:response regulator transcription factor n=1 Tax=Neorhizobium sp. SOG26 TaxID=2060726 RepID=UPI000E57D8D3|nr:DNA-binding response regulator [Neorhizobium sp. SOG26]AXV18383.1 DNA-binding response regulator [Neorhizobium sp. SOG26]